MLYIAMARDWIKFIHATEVVEHGRICGFVAGQGS
jgi:hypothetical protein